MKDCLINNYLSEILPEGWAWIVIDSGNELVVYPPDIPGFEIPFYNLHTLELFFKLHINK